MEEFIRLRRAALEKFFERMNPMQQKAVFRINGPLLILAGAGSGKTTVLVNRIANMIFFGDAYNSDMTCNIPDESDLAFLKAYISGDTGDGKRLAEVAA